MKKALIVVGLIAILFLLMTFVSRNFLEVPLASYQSKKDWTEHKKGFPKINSSEFSVDSIRNFPNPIGLVSDFEHVFNESQVSYLTEIISEYEQKTRREIAIVTVSAIEPYENIADYSTDLANEWGIGKLESDNGLLILLSKNLRQIQISTGLGTEKKLTDEICKKVIDETIIPEFRNGNYYIGVEKGLSELISIWE